MPYVEKRNQTELMYEEMWNLDTSVVKGAWWWWWWIFFIRNPENPEKCKQLMILWSTKNVENIKVNELDWKRKRIPSWDNDGVMRFNGMTAAWYYDGEKMVEPLVLCESDFEVTRNKDGSGRLHPVIEGKDYDFFGNLDKMTVNIKDENSNISLNILPWNHEISEIKFKKNDYLKKYHYTILKQYGSLVEGEINGQKVSGSAYFQKLLVNAPQPPWYWVINQFEDGSYLDYMYANVGLQLFRKKYSHKSILDRCEFPIKKMITFYHHPSRKVFKFKKVKIKHTYKDDLPTFIIDGQTKDGEGTIHLKYECYSRAYWRFEEKGIVSKPVLYYNEYPSVLTEFEMNCHGIKLTRKDLGNSVSNNEHAWGMLL